MNVDLEMLAQTGGDELYREACAALGAVSGQHTVEGKVTDQVLLMKLVKWAKVQHAAQPAVPEKQISMSELEAEQKNDVAARARLAEYANLGLLDTESNARQIKNWVIQNKDGIWNVENVDSAVHTLGEALQWRKEEPPPAESASEVLVTLSDGTTQLPLEGTTPLMLRRASIPQVHDWHRRKEKITPKVRIPGRRVGNIF